MRSTRSRSRAAAFFGLMLALSLVASYIESLIPFYFGVPGMKLGLCNALVLVIMYLYSPGYALLVNVMRIVLAGFMFGNAFSIIYSLAGGLTSFAGMWFLKRTKRFSVTGVSAAGGVLHNMGQLAAAAVLVKNYRVGFYGPALIIAGVVTGITIGTVASELIKRLTVLHNE